MLSRAGYLLGLLAMLLHGVQVAVAQLPPLTFRNYFTQHGLSYNYVFTLLEDREGYIWVGTFNGLNRFDGSRFITFKTDPDDAASLSNNVIYKLCEDSSGNIWMATGHGISRYNKLENRFTRYFAETNSTDYFRNNNFLNIICDRSGKIWCASPGGLYLLNPETGQFTSFKQGSTAGTLTTNDIIRKTLHLDPEKNWLWMGTGAGINIFDLDKKVFYNHRNNPYHIPVLNDHVIFPLIFDRKKQVLFADNTTHEIIVYDPVAKTTTRHTEAVQKNPSNKTLELAALEVDKANNYWVSTFENSLHHYNSQGKTWSRFQHDNANPSSINSDYFNDMLEDKHGRLYFGCLNGLAIHDFTRSPYRQYQPLQQLPAILYPEISCLHSTSNERVYIGTNRAGLIHANINKEQYKHIEIPARFGKRFANEIVSIAPRGKHMWLGTGAGVLLLDTLTHSVTRPNLPGFPAFMDDRFIRFVHHDQFNQTWISVNRVGIVQYDHHSGSYKLHKPDSLFIGPGYKTTGFACAEDKAGNFWVGTYSGKLYRYDRAADTFQNIIADTAKAKRIVQRTITSMYADEAGRVWMTTDGSGLVLYDPATKSFRNWTEKDGLLLNMSTTVFGDAVGNIWVGSYEGISILDPRSGKVTHPNLDYGQRENSFYSKGYCLLPNGNILFPNKGRLIQLDPKKVLTPVAVPEVKITGITIAGHYTPLYLHSPAPRFSYRDNVFSIDFSTLQAITNRNVEFNYRLIGLSDKWISGFQHNASFTGLPGGNYTFEVRARLPNGQWSPVAAMKIYIKPPFWQTWWFRIIAALLIIGALIIYIKLRERRIIREQKLQSDFRERTMLLEMKALRSQMNPHFIYNSLNSIRLFVMQNQNEDADKYLVQFSRLMRLILDNSRHELVSLQSELDLLRLYMELEQLRFDHKFDFHMEVDKALSPEQVFLPPMLLQPYVENAILHGLRHKPGKGNIIICIGKQDRQLRCEIDDDGIGRGKAAQFKRPSVKAHKSIGTQVTEERIRLLKSTDGAGASIQFIDKTGANGEAAGTKVILSLPLITSHALQA